MTAALRIVVCILLIPPVFDGINACCAASQDNPATEIKTTFKKSSAASSSAEATVLDDSPESVDPGFCVIQPDEPASIEIFADHNGRRSYFCCELCRQDFLSDPSRFDGLTEPAESTAELEFWNPTPDAYADTFWGRIGRAILLGERAATWVYVTLNLRDPLSAVTIGTAVLWLAFLAYQWRRTRRSISGFRPSVQVVVLITLLFVPCFYANALRVELTDTKQQYEQSESERLHMKARVDEMEDRDQIHYATFFNYGNPPVPRPSKLPPSLRKTYYRGNDERSDQMAHGGNYRTVTFKIWIETESGEVVQPGTSISDSNGKPIKLFMGVRFIRASETSSGYFTDKYMQRMYLTMQTGDFLGRDEPVADRVQWTMTEHEKVWEARFPLPEGVIVKEKAEHARTSEQVRMVDPSRPIDRGGIVYLCEDRFERSEVIGGRFHYAVQYDLETEDGVVLPDSDLWMQATYYGRNFADMQIEAEEWLSSEPIPEK